MKVHATIVLLLLFAVPLTGQDRYMVFFADKANSPYSVNDPSEYLSPASIDRRVKYNIDITEQDLPVNPGYIAEVVNTGAQAFYTTKWLNGLLVEANVEQIATIEQLAFVSSTRMVGTGAPLSSGGRHEATQKTMLTEVDESAVQNNLIGTDLMNALGYTGTGIRIAVIDSGFEGVDQMDAFSSFRQSNGLVDTWDFVGNEDNVYHRDVHGTWVFSIMAAHIPETYYGVAPDAEYTLYITEDINSEQPIEEYNILFAAERADSVGVDVMSMSLGYIDFDAPFTTYTLDDLDGQTAVSSQVVKFVAERGMVFITSAGNRYYWDEIAFPADCLDCLTVGSVRPDRQLSTFSSVGPTADGRTKPDVVALGTGVGIVHKDDNVIFKSGTSLASPQIVGFVAGLWQANPELSATEIMDLVRSSGDRSDMPDNQFGHGIPHFSHLVSSLNDSQDWMFPLVYPNPFTGNRITLKWPEGIDLADWQITLTDLMGKEIEFIKSDNPGSSESNLTLRDIGSGLYLLNMRSGNKVRTMRLIHR